MATRRHVQDVPVCYGTFAGINILPPAERNVAACVQALKVYLIERAVRSGDIC